MRLRQADQGANHLSRRLSLKDKMSATIQEAQKLGISCKKDGIKMRI
jgi:hypothetical protein